MCSSPRSSGSSPPRRRSNTGHNRNLTLKQRARFTEVANRADERREQRITAKKKEQQSQTINTEQKSEDTNSSILSWFSRLGVTH